MTIQESTEQANKAATEMALELGYDLPTNKQVEALDGADDKQIKKNSRPPLEDRIGAWLNKWLYRGVNGIKWCRRMGKKKKTCRDVESDCSGCTRKKQDNARI